MTKFMSYFLHLCDCSVPYCAYLGAWKWVGAGQHLHASHPQVISLANSKCQFIFRQLFLEQLKKAITLRPLELLT